MARPYPDAFEREPPSSLSSSSGSSLAPVSFQTNVNRQKTQKWFDVPRPDYGGDGWGDEYNSYEPPPPVVKPIGPRQPVQASKPLIDKNKKDHGELPPLPSDASHISLVKNRPNSFLPDDESRGFSNMRSGQAVPPMSTEKGSASRLSPNAAIQLPTSQSNPSHSLGDATQASASMGFRTAGAKPPSPAEAQDTQAVGQKAYVTESRIGTPSKNSAPRTDFIDPQNRQEYSPTVGLSFQTRSSAVPSVAIGDPSSRFPPRKSSVDQRISTEMPDNMRSMQEIVEPKPKAEAPPNAYAYSQVSPTKSHPGIRSANVYKHDEEERWKERQTIDSSRPNMDSTVGEVARDRSSSPVMKSSLRTLPSSDSLGGAVRIPPAPEIRDKQESNTRSAPLLDPVKERKSEYGFEYYDTTLSEKASNGTKSDGHRGRQNEAAQLVSDDDKRSSLSLKLPDLNLPSELRVDFLHPESNRHNPISATKAPLDNPPSETLQDSSLAAHSSLGFKSVVQQAFDTSRQIPASEMPISPGGSGVRRADSESTDTAGISPIMSWAPSVTMVKGLAHQRDRPGTQTPVITELGEPDSNRSSSPMLKDPLNRKSTPNSRINTPGPSDSQSRTHKLKATEKLSVGETVYIPEISDVSASSFGKGSPQYQRLEVERKQSSRSGFPDGSVADSFPASGTIVGPEHSQKARYKTPVVQSSNNLVVATATSDISPATLTADKSGPNGNLSLIPPAKVPGASALATSDHSTSKSYTSIFTEPHIPYNDERKQLKETSQFSSSQTNPANLESPDAGQSDSHGELRIDRSDSFSPIAPLKQRAPQEIASSKDIPPIVDSQNLPALSTNTSPHDEESDRLRKEIVRSLEPRASADNRELLPPLNSFELGWREENVFPAGRESTYLPSEYEKYWESTDGLDTGEHGEQASGRPRSILPEELPAPQVGPSPAIPEEVAVNVQVIALPGAKRVDKTSGGGHQSRFPNRFSWEAGPENVSALSVRTKNEIEHRMPTLASFSETPNTPIRQLEERGEAYSEHGQVGTSPIPESSSAIGKLPPLKTTTVSQVVERQIEPETSLNSGNDSPLPTKIAAPAATVTKTGHDGSLDDPERVSSPNTTIRVVESTQEISPIKSGDEYPAVSSKPQLESSPVPGTPSPPMIAKPLPDLGKIVQFKEILALPQSYQRINSFNETRYQFAAMDTGLNLWLQSLSSQQELMSETWVSSNSNADNNASKSRSQKLGGSSLPALQQPYYQQYLNASPATSAPLVSRPGTAGITSGSQGFSPSNSKSSTQQKQSKSKDLLHSAGILGGKASKAGKGLISKGKNRFRGNGSGDKTSSPPNAASSTKPKPDDRRSSWGVSLSSLTLSRTSSQRSEVQTPSHQHGRRTLSENLPAEKSKVANEGELSLWDAPVSAESTPSIPPALPHLSNTNEAQASHETGGGHEFPNVEDNKYDLGIPAPIGKTQPSWDPTNVTPIVEEEGFQYDDPTSKTLQGSLPSPTGLTALSLQVDPSRSGLAGSAEVTYYDALGKPIDPEDWVIVSKQEATSQPEEISARIQEGPAISLSQPIRSKIPTVVPKGPPTLTGSTIANPFPTASFQKTAPNLQQSPQNTTPTILQNSPAVAPGSSPITPDMRYTSSHIQEPLSGLLPTFSPSIPLSHPNTGRSGTSTFNHNPTLYRNIPTSGPNSTEPVLHNIPQPGPVFPQNPGLLLVKSAPTWNKQSTDQEKPSPRGVFRGILKHMPRRSKDNTTTKDNTTIGTPELPKIKRLKGTPTPEYPQATWLKRPKEAYTPPITSNSPDFARIGQFEHPQAYSDSVSRQSFVGLPPLRRTSTFAVGFSPQLSGTNLVIDEGPQRPFSIVPTPQDKRPPVYHGFESQAGTGHAMVLVRGFHETSQLTPPRQSSDDIAVPGTFNRLVAVQTNPEYSQIGVGEVSPISASHSSQPSPERTPGVPQEFGHQAFSPIAQRPEDLWRPSQTILQQRVPQQLSEAQQPQFEPQRNATPAGQSSVQQISAPQVVNRNQPSFDSVPQALYQRRPSLGVQQITPQAPQLGRASYEDQHIRSPLNTVQGNGSEYPGAIPASRNVKHQYQKSIEQPPSSTQRYPELFKPRQPGDQNLLDEREPPAHYYQTPVSREEALLPRQQTNEYQLPGVGPPPDEPQSGSQSRRNSGFFKEISGRLSRTASHNQGSTRDEDNRSPSKPLGLTEADKSEVSITSEDIVEKKGPGPGQFGAPTSTSAGSVVPPQTDKGLLAGSSGQSLASPDKNQLFSGNQPSPAQMDPRTNNFLGASLSEEQAPKKKRLSNLTTMFSRGSSEQSRDPGAEMTQGLQDKHNLPNPVTQQMPRMRGISHQPSTTQRETPLTSNSNASSLTNAKAENPSYPQSSQHTATSTRPGQPNSSVQNPRNFQQTATSPHVIESPQINMRIPENLENVQQETGASSTARHGPQRSVPESQDPPNSQRRRPLIITHVAQLAKDPKPREQNSKLQIPTFSHANNSSQPPPVQPPKGPLPLPPTQNPPVVIGREKMQILPAAQSVQLPQKPQPSQNLQPTPLPQLQQQNPPPVTAARYSLLPPLQQQPNSQHRRRQLSDSALPAPSATAPLETSNPSVPQEPQRAVVAPQPAPRNSSERLDILPTHDRQPSQPRVEKKLRQSSAARFLSGLMGSRRSAEQQERKFANPRAGSPAPPQGLPSQPQIAPLKGEARGSQERGVPPAQEPKYDTPPIPSAYHLVRGEGAQLAPTPYDPRGLNIRFGTQVDPILMYQQSVQILPSQSVHTQGQQAQNLHATQVQQPNGSQPSILATPDQNAAKGQATGSPPNPVTPHNNSRPLSNEDLMARSPARRPLGQQAPYQLTLPSSPTNGDPWDRQLPVNNNAPAEYKTVNSRRPNMDNNPERKLLTERGVTATRSMTTSQNMIHPALRQPNQPTNDSLPDGQGFSVKPSVDYGQLSAKSSSNQLSANPHGIDRSNTKNIQTKETSHISGPKSLNVPGVQRDHTPATPLPPQITPPINPEPSPERIGRRPSPRPRPEEDLYSASPRPSPEPRSRTSPIPRVAIQETSDEKAEEAGLSENKARPSEFQGKLTDSTEQRILPPPEEKIVSQEEKILADETFLDVEDEIATMSATSYPGQEWHPIMNGYEDWD